MIPIEHTDKKELFRIINQYNLNIDTIYDCGSRDALDGIELFQKLNAKEIHIFECNPPSVQVCNNNLYAQLGKDQNNIVWFLNDFAIADHLGEIEFRPINPDRTITPHKGGNPGASSIFLASDKYTKETYVQNLIKVPVKTLNNYTENRKKPDLLWMDLQGAELLALKGSSKILDHVKIIHLEVSFREMYKGQCLYFELDNFLKKENFKQISIDIGNWPKWFFLYKIFKTGPWLGNAIYINKRYI